MSVEHTVTIAHRHVVTLEELHLALLTARLRKRRSLRIDASDLGRFQDAVKAALPAPDFSKHGF